MKKKSISILGISLLLVMMFSLNSFASSGQNLTVQVGTGSVFVNGVSKASRTGNYNYIYVNVESVYPVEGKDTFTKCKVRIYKCDWTGAAFSNIYTLTEGNGNQTINLYNGGLSCLQFDIRFAGNDPE
ncbi:MAG: hypothetical protein NC240_11005, partial [Clostridium sp.]|nr:hypothetical protein [Clostridium sp.]